MSRIGLANVMELIERILTLLEGEDSSFGELAKGTGIKVSEIR